MSTATTPIRPRKQRRTSILKINKTVETSKVKLPVKASDRIVYAFQNNLLKKREVTFFELMKACSLNESSLGQGLGYLLTGEKKMLDTFTVADTRYYALRSFNN